MILHKINEDSIDTNRKSLLKDAISIVKESIKEHGDAKLKKHFKFFSNNDKYYSDCKNDFLTGEENHLGIAELDIHEYSGGNAREAMESGELDTLASQLKKVEDDVNKKLSKKGMKFFNAGDWDDYIYNIKIINNIDESSFDEELLTEGLFSKKEAPEEFIKFAIDFFGKVDKKLKLKNKKGKSYKEYIKDKKEMKYIFDIDDPRLDYWKGLVKAGAKGAVAGAVGGAVGGSTGDAIMIGGLTANNAHNFINEEKERQNLDKVIVSCGIKDKPKNKWHDNVRSILSKSKEYIYISWPAVAAEDSTFTTYAICLQCLENNEKNKKKYLNEAAVPEEPKDLDKFFDGLEGIDPSLVADPEENFYRDPVYNKAITEHFNILDTKTRKILLSMNEAGQNSVLMSLTSKLYDKIVEKCDDIDYGEIPNTNGDITKLSKYNSMKETIAIMHDILEEYKQDTGPVDELSVAFANVEARKDLFERAYRYNSELPIAMYCNIVLGIITGISYMIATCIEFIKDPGAESFRIALDKTAYAKTKDHMIYNTLKSFNKTCANKEFDKAMEAVLKSSTKNFGGAAIAGGIAIGVLGTILVLIPVLRELIFMFYYMRMKVSDFFDIQADLLQMNSYSLEANETIHPDERKKIVAKQLKYVDKFRKVSNTFAFDIKKAEIEADKEKKSDDETKMLIDDIDGLDSGSNVSALF